MSSTESEAFLETSCDVSICPNKAYDTQKTLS